MAKSPHRRLPYPICQQLQSKKLMMLVPGENPTLDDVETAGYVNYWCLYSMTDTGPDDKYVEYKKCTPDRECYVPPGE